MAMLKDMFVGADKPKSQKPPSTSSAQVQNATTDARRRAMLASGRQSTIIAGNNLGSTSSSA